MIVAPIAKLNVASKNHPKEILCDKNHLYGILLVHLTSNVAFTTFSVSWILIFDHENLKFYLTLHICKPKCQTKHHTAAILQQNNATHSTLSKLSYIISFGYMYTFHLTLIQMMYIASTLIVHVVPAANLPDRQILPTINLSEIFYS